MFITFTFLETPNRAEIALYNSVLASDGRFSGTVDSFKHEASINSVKIVATDVNIGLQNAVGILKLIRFYLHAVNLQTITDIAEFYDPYTDDYVFQENFVGKYFKFYGKKDSSITNSENACMVSLELSQVLLYKF